jgi:hypothetical protein
MKGKMVIFASDLVFPENLWNKKSPESSATPWEVYNYCWISPKMIPLSKL